MRHIELSNNIILDAKKNAFQYQKDAFEAVKDLEYSAIFHEQGLGKTKIAIDLMLYWISKKEIDTVLVVTKKQLIKNWIDEIKFHTFLNPATLSSNKNENFYIFNSARRVIITNFETISGEKDRFKLFLKTRNVAIVIDESTKIKNPYSRLTEDFFELSDFFKIRVIMTGTPVANRPYDIWAQIYFLDKGKSLGSNFEEFKNFNNLDNDLFEKEEKRNDFENNVSSIFEKIKSFTVRETKHSGKITLPKKNYYIIKADFEPIQKQMYDTIKNDLSILVQKDDNAILDDSSESLKRLLRLIQITSNPRLIDDLYGCESGKEKELDDLINEIVSRGEKLIVWSMFIENVNYFYEKYKSLNPIRIHGSLAIDDRNRSITKFKNDDTCKIMFATPQAAKEGLTLTVANNVIFYDRGFNLDDYLQAQDRIHRISQTKECNIYNIIINDSIDIWVDLLLQAKQNAAFLAQGDVNIDEYKKIIDYSFGDIIKEILKGEEHA